MSKNRKSRSSARPAYPTAVEILKHRKTIKEVVVKCGVPAEEIEDVVAAIVLAALTAIEQDRYRLTKGADRVNALGAWLMGIAWRQSRHEQGRARHRREVLVDDPWALLAEPAGPDIENQVEARRALLLVVQLSPTRQDALTASTEVDGVKLLAKKCGITARGALQRIHYARRCLRNHIDHVDADGSEASATDDD